MYDLTRFTFRPNMAGHQFDDPLCGCPTRVIGDFELIYFTGGRGFIKIKETMYECTAGDVIFIRPFEEHSIQSSREEPYDNFWVHFDINPDYLHNEFVDAFFPENNGKINIGVSQSLCNLYSEMLLELIQKKEGSKIMFEHYFSIIAITICRKIISTRNNGNIKPVAIPARNKFYGDINLLDRAEDYIARNFDTCIKINDICTVLSVSPSYLFKIFKRYLNMTPTGYITQVRLRRAEYLMKNSSYSLKDIACRSGFADVFYFSRVFKKTYGHSPGEYLKRLMY